MKLGYFFAIHSFTLTCSAISSSPEVGVNGKRDSRTQITLGCSQPEARLIELSPGQTRWVLEQEKWALKRQEVNFMDITDAPHLGKQSTAYTARQAVLFPNQTAFRDNVTDRLNDLNTSGMKENLQGLTSFHTRYYKSRWGRESAKWLLGKINDTIVDAGADQRGVDVRTFEHPWGQPSLIVTVPGQSNKTVVIGAHQDSINLYFPSIMPAPGADDDGSGTVTILEALRVLLQAPEVLGGDAENTVEFHWYSAEEGGLLGSQAIFSQYEEQGRDVRAMLQQDMTGYVQKTLEAGEPESVSVITDFVDQGLTEFIKTVIETYCDIPYVLTKCGYACSDHASASKAGYPSAFVIESDFKYSDTYIHSAADTIDRLSFDHMLQHAKLTLGLAYELAFAKL